ncbi:UvrD-helicase domain-containing protein [Bacillus toyonensis]
MDLCQRRFLYSSVLDGFSTYRSSFHQQFLIGNIIKIYGAIGKDKSEIIKILLHLFPFLSHIRLDSLVNENLNKNYVQGMREYGLGRRREYEGIKYSDSVTYFQFLTHRGAFQNEKWKTAFELLNEKKGRKKELIRKFTLHPSILSEANPSEFCKLCPHNEYCEEAYYDVDLAKKGFDDNEVTEYEELDFQSKTDYAFDLLNQALSMDSEGDNHIYNETEQFLKNISLSDDQQKVATMNSTHLLIKGCAGSGKSITLLTRMMQKMSEEIGKRFLFVSFSKELVKDAQNRFKTSKYFQQLQGQNHQVEFLTFHELAYQLLKSIQIKVPLFFTSHQNLNKKDDAVRGRMLRLIRLLETDEFKTLPSIYTIRKTENTNFLLEEFSWMKGNGFIKKEDYLTCKRVGRGRLPSISEKQRTTIFRLFEYYVEEQKKTL